MRIDNKKKNFWISEKQDKLLKEKCKKAGITEKEFLIRCIENKTIMEKPDKEFYKAVNTIRPIARNINQIAAIANKKGFIDIRRYNENINEINKFIIDIRKRFLIGTN